MKHSKFRSVGNDFNQRIVHFLPTHLALYYYTATHFATLQNAYKKIGKTTETQNARWDEINFFPPKISLCDHTLP